MSGKPKQITDCVNLNFSDILSSSLVMAGLGTDEKSVLDGEENWGKTTAAMWIFQSPNPTFSFRVRNFFHFYWFSIFALVLRSKATKEGNCMELKDFYFELLIVFLLMMVENGKKTKYFKHNCVF